MVEVEVKTPFGRMVEVKKMVEVEVKVEKFQSCPKFITTKTSCRPRS